MVAQVSISAGDLAAILTHLTYGGPEKALPIAHLPRAEILMTSA